MTLSDLRHLFAYSRWASDRLIAAAAELTAEEWKRDLRSSFPSVAATVAHILGAEWLWLRRWQGESPTQLPGWVEESMPELLRAVNAEVHADRDQFMSTLGDVDLSRIVAYRRLNGEAGEQPLGDLMMHVVNHSTYHRGQVVTLLRQLDVTPPTTDLFVFNAERHAREKARHG